MIALLSIVQTYPSGSLVCQGPTRGTLPPGARRRTPDRSRTRMLERACISFCWQTCSLSIALRLSSISVCECDHNLKNFRIRVCANITTVDLDLTFDGYYIYAYVYKEFTIITDVEKRGICFLGLASCNFTNKTKIYLCYRRPKRRSATWKRRCNTCWYVNSCSDRVRLKEYAIASPT